jgi:hypothetical protein
MLDRRRMLQLIFCSIVFHSLLFGQHRGTTGLQRDAQSISILARVVGAGGGVEAVAAIRDLTETGEITFYWGDGVKGPVTIHAIGGRRFRMDAELPQGKTTWIVKDGFGSKKEDDKPVPLSNLQAINLGNLTFPIGQAAAALEDSATEVSLVDTEKREGRSVYRLHLKGQLGLVSKSGPRASVAKDLIVDASNFEILGVEDMPFGVGLRNGQKVHVPPRQIEYGDFRIVDGVRVPFSIHIKLLGQSTLSIRLSEVSPNSGLNDEDFRN